MATHSTPSQDRLLTPAFVTLSLAEFAYFTAQGMEIPLAPLFAARALDASEVGIGIAVGALAVTALVLRPFAGRTSDRRGRRPLLIGGAVLYGLTTAAHALAPNLEVMVGLRLTLGVADAFFFVAGFAALADLAPPGRTGEALSINSLALYLGIALGPLLGQGLLRTGGFSLAWLGAASLCFLAALLAWRLPETSTPTATGSVRPPLIHRASLVPGALLFSGIAVMSGFFTFLALHAEAIGVTGWGGVMFAFGLVVVGTRLVFAKLPDRLPPYRLGTASLALMGIGVAVVAVARSSVGLYSGAVLLALGVAFTTPAFFTAVLSRVSPQERGTAMGTMSGALDLAFSSGPILFGVVAASRGIPGAFLTGSGLAAVGAMGALVAHHAERRANA